MKIFLIGYMGAGKTSKGKKLAQQIGYQFIDMDQYIENEEGMSVREIFSLRGEDWFRQKERETLLDISGLEGNYVISTGGGVPCYNNNMDFINSAGISVYLKMSPEGLVKRLTRSNKPERPLLRGKTEPELFEFVKQKLGEREKFYLEATHIINAETFELKELISVLHL